MSGWRARAAMVVVLATATAIAVTGCGHAITGTPTWPGARLEQALLTAADFPKGVQYDRIVDAPGRPDGQGGPPAMLSTPKGCSDGLTRLIAADAERGPGSALKYVVAYDGARIVMTLLSSRLDLDALAAEADRCAAYQTFFDPAMQGIPVTTKRLPTPRPKALGYQQSMRLGSESISVFFAFENVGDSAVFGLAFATPNPAIAVKATLPQTFLDISAKQAQRLERR
jgi:hypothetical protein